MGSRHRISLFLDRHCLLRMHDVAQCGCRYLGVDLFLSVFESVSAITSSDHCKRSLQA